MNLLLSALRQYRHNTDELLMGYDKEETDRIVGLLRTRINELNHIISTAVEKYSDLQLQRNQNDELRRSMTKISYARKETDETIIVYVETDAEATVVVADLWRSGLAYSVEVSESEGGDNPLEDDC